MTASSTWVACLTPPGTAAIATLALRGPRAWDIACQFFRPAPSTAPVAGTFRLGRFGDSLSDEVVLSVRRADPEPWLELHCHGGREVIRLLLETIELHGGTLCTWEELEQRTATDRLRALAAAELTQTLTQRCAAILLDQLNGAFSSAISATFDALHCGDATTAVDLLTGLSRHARLGRRLTTPWRVTVAGAPNVGKSSLVNALAGYQRSVVSAVPGTTRDVVTTLVAVDGWPIELADTAGLREDAAALESIGIEQARGAAREADLCLWVVDASTAAVWPTVASRAVRLVVNKIDLAPAWDLSSATGAIRVSAHTGAGMGELCQALASWLVPEPSGPGAAVPFTADLAERVEAALDRLCAGDPAGVLRLLGDLRP